VPSDLPPISLGFEVAAWMHENLVHGPGDVEDEPFRLSDEQLRFVAWTYALDDEGRRRYRRATYSRRKGTAKTELAAAITWAEFAGPVRFAGWTPDGCPIGQPVRSPLIPLAAVSEDQAEETLYGCFRRMIRDDLADEFDIGLERTLKRSAPGAVKLVTSSSVSREGARPTFTACDETHLWWTPELRDLHKTLRRNLAKRLATDPWMLEVTTAHRPGQGSVAEASHELGAAITRGRVLDATFLFDHREADERHDIATDDGLIAAVREASGDAWAFTNLAAIMDEFRDPTLDEADCRRFWLNQVFAAADQWMDPDEWRACAATGSRVAEREAIVLGFDGSDTQDATALVGCRISDGHLFTVAVWEQPPGATAEWRVPRDDVDQTVGEAMRYYNVVRLYCDPYLWETFVEQWAARHGDQIVARWLTNRRRQMAYALSRMRTAVRAGQVTHDGSEPLTRHVLNARRWDRPEGTLIRKEHPKSANKIDGAIAAALAFEARADAVAAGALKPVDRTVVFL